MQQPFAHGRGISRSLKRQYRQTNRFLRAQGSLIGDYARNRRQDGGRGGGLEPAARMQRYEGLSDFVGIGEPARGVLMEAARDYAVL